MTWFFTDPNNPDSDGDGLLDGEEISLGFDPNNPFGSIFVIILVIIVCIFFYIVIWRININRKNKEFYDNRLISIFKEKIKKAEELKTLGDFEKVINIFEEQLSSFDKLYDPLKKETFITTIKNSIDDKFFQKLQKNSKKERN